MDEKGARAGPGAEQSTERAKLSWNSLKSGPNGEKIWNVGKKRTSKESNW